MQASNLVVNTAKTVALSIAPQLHLSIPIVDYNSSIDFAFDNQMAQPSTCYSRIAGQQSRERYGEQITNVANAPTFIVNKPHLKPEVVNICYINIRYTKCVKPSTQ